MVFQLPYLLPILPSFPSRKVHSLYHDWRDFSKSILLKHARALRCLHDSIQTAWNSCFIKISLPSEPKRIMPGFLSPLYPCICFSFYLAQLSTHSHLPPNHPPGLSLHIILPRRCWLTSQSRVLTTPSFLLANCNHMYFICSSPLQTRSSCRAGTINIALSILAIRLANSNAH